MTTLAFSIVLTILGTMCAAVGQIMLKKASPRMSITVEGVIKNLPFIFGLIFYGASMTLCIIALKWGPLTLLNPIGSLNYVWAAFLSMWFLGEKMNKYKWLGVITIIVGVTVLVQ